MSQMKTVTKMSKDQWHKERDKGLGGSDCAAALGQNRWKSPYRLWLEKTGQIKSFEGNEKTQIGLEVEEAIFQMAKTRLEEQGMDVLHNNQFFKSDEHNFMLGNIDGDIYDPSTQSWGVLEIKFTSPYMKKEWEGEEIPQEYILQLQHYFIVTERDWGFLAVLIGNEDFILKRVERDEELCQMIIDGERDFWDCVKSNTPPAIDGSESTREVMDILYPAENVVDNTIRLPQESKELIETIDQLSSQIKDLENLKKEKENQLKNLLGENEEGLVDNWKVTWKKISSSRFDSKAFKKEHPKMYEQFAKEKTYRRFSIKRSD